MTDRLIELDAELRDFFRLLLDAAFPLFAFGPPHTVSEPPCPCFARVQGRERFIRPGKSDRLSTKPPASM